MFFDVKSVQVIEKDGSRWMRDPKNMMDVGKFHIPSH